MPLGYLSGLKMAEKQQKAGKAVLIYDGSCPICQRAIEWIKGSERKDSFEMLPCQSEEVRRRFPLIEESICMGAMQLILPDGQILSGERALPEILRRLKRHRLAAWLFRLPGSKILARSFYRWFARHRYYIAKAFLSDKREGKG
jgi:predicted DCC family thiol-disulfide oxidoreductase YuxK